VISIHSYSIPAINLILTAKETQFIASPNFEIHHMVQSFLRSTECDRLMKKMSTEVIPGSCFTISFSLNFG
jgi:hypothetical protein